MRVTRQLCRFALVLLILLFDGTLAGQPMAKLGPGMVLRREYGTEGFEYLFLQTHEIGAIRAERPEQPQRTTPGVSVATT